MQLLELWLANAVKNLHVLYINFLDDVGKFNSYLQFSLKTINFLVSFLPPF